jgi:hypothetical protein
MADPSQFTFSMAEATVALLKKQGIHDGKWVLSIEFGLNIGMMGASPTDVKPGVMILANNIVLQRAIDGSPANLIIDAAVVNPSIDKKAKK